LHETSIAMQSQLITKNVSSSIEDMKSWLQGSDLAPDMVKIILPKLTELEKQILRAGKSSFSMPLVWHYGNLTAVEKTTMNNRCGSLVENGQLQEVRDWRELSPEDMRGRKPLAAWVFLSKECEPQEVAMSLDHLINLAPLFPVLTFVSDLDWDTYFEQRSQIKTPHVKFESWSEFAAIEMDNDLLLLNDSKTIEMLVAVQYLQQIGEINQLLVSAGKAYESELKMRRMQASQEEAMNRSKSSGAQRNSLASEIKNRLSETTTQFETRFQSDVENTIDSKQGSLVYDQMLAALEKLPMLEEEKRAKNIAFIIPAEFNEKWFAYLKNQLIDFSEKSRQQAKLYCESLESSLSEQLRTNAISISLPLPPSVDKAQLTRMLEDLVRVEKPYEGLITKKKPMELLSGARMYFMIFMMLSAMFGLSSELRKHKAYYVPFTISLLGLGVWQYLSNLRKEKAETNEKYYQGAQDYLKRELSRILSEYETQWERMVLQPIKQWVKLVGTEVETAVLKLEQQHQEVKEMDAQKTRVLAESLRTQDSNLSTALKSKKSDFDRNFLSNQQTVIGQLKVQLVRFRGGAQTMSTSDAERKKYSA
jgi:hypothetical protein